MPIVGQAVLEVVRLDDDAVADVALRRISAGQVSVALVTELKVGYSARSTPDYDATRHDLPAGPPDPGDHAGPRRAAGT